ncbi:MAG: sodium:proton antiporter [Candidatus Krumholzibacteriia bacterium]
MPIEAQASPALTIALAMAAGIICQVVARHLRLPGIVLLLGAGVGLGPDGLGWIMPASLGADLHVIVGFATAVILFEGGLSLQRKRLQREAAVLRRLLSIGALVTAVGGTLASHWLLGWPWSLAVPFGALVVVTGPTVITPLLRRIKVRRELETLLEAEGILIDGIGAILAVVVIEVVTVPHLDATHGLTTLVMRVGFGIAAGLVGGLVMAGSLRIARLVPQDLDNPFTLAMVLVLFQACNAVMPETGIVAAIIAGMVVGNAGLGDLHDLREFKEQLTVMLIGMLFVILAADVRLAQVQALGMAGLVTVLLLMLVVRPAAVLASTLGEALPWRQRAFLAWVAPRGIIAAAVGSLFAERLEEAHIAGGLELRALIFLVILMTVVVQGLTAGPLARLLGLQRPSDQGYAILGAHALGRLVAGRLRQTGEPVVLLDSNAEACQQATDEGFRVVFGNALEETAQRRAGMESRRAAIGLLANPAVNLRFVERARRESKVSRALVAVPSASPGLEREAFDHADTAVLFGNPRDVDLWDLRLRRGLAALETWTLDDGQEVAAPELPRETHALLLPLVRHRKDDVVPVDSSVTFKPGDEVEWLVFADRAAEARAWLEAAGWRPPAETTPSGGFE